MAKIKDMFRLRKVGGEVGIEIEIEGIRLPGHVAKYWHVEGDGSLRGDGFEYVSQPLPVDQVQTALVHLWETFKANRSSLKPSDRCGVHIHLNMQTWTFQQTMTFICLYLVLEDLLVRWCGEDREGNLFCLRGKDAEYIYDILIQGQQRGTFRGLHGLNGDMRYSSINLNSLRKFGTLEFRALRTPKDYKTIQLWAEMLLKIREASKDFSIPPAVVEGVSMEGGQSFVDMVMGKYAKELICPNMDVLMMNGVRRIQEIAYEEGRPQELEDAEEDDPEVEFAPGHAAPPPVFIPPKKFLDDPGPGGGWAVWVDNGDDEDEEEYDF
jgi:hypothetical protein